MVYESLYGSNSGYAVKSRKLILFLEIHPHIFFKRVLEPVHDIMHGIMQPTHFINNDW